MDYQRLYEYRFRSVPQAEREATWREIARFIHGELESPERILDVGAGRCEFINAVPAPERWALDEVAYDERAAHPDVRFLSANAMEAELPGSYFDAVWVSNFLEHLDSQAAVSAFLDRIRETIRPGGQIAVMGPNFRYAAREYFDCADHNVPLTHVAVAEHLFAAGFEPVRVEPRFLPYSFRSRLPAGTALVRAYLRIRPAWRLFGKQFLVIGRREA